MTFAAPRGGLMVPGTENLTGREWGRAQTRVLSYEDEVLAPLSKLPETHAVRKYGEAQYDDLSYDLMAVQIGNLHNGKPNVYIEGGVHGYETGGVAGALSALETVVPRFSEYFNFLVVPCVNPWSFEHDARFNGEGTNINRDLTANPKSQEAKALISMWEQDNVTYRMAWCLHETPWTDTDVSEQSGDEGLGRNVDPNASYILANSLNWKDGDPIAAFIAMQALAAAGWKVSTEPYIHENTNIEGVLYNNLGFTLNGSSIQYMTRETEDRNPLTQLAFTTEIFVPEAMYRAPHGLQQRAQGQTVQLQAVLDHLKDRPHTDPKSFWKPRFAA